MEQSLLNATEFIYLMLIICVMLLIGWLWFFSVVRKNGESVKDLISGTSFLQNLTVLGVVLSSGILAVIGVLKGELVATLLSGIVGYVLGSIKTHEKG